jgi:hypothetical protein
VRVLEGPFDPPRVTSPSPAAPASTSAPPTAACSCARATGCSTPPAPSRWSRPGASAARPSSPASTPAPTASATTARPPRRGEWASTFASSPNNATLRALALHLRRPLRQRRGGARGRPRPRLRFLRHLRHPPGRLLVAPRRRRRAQPSRAAPHRTAVSAFGSLRELRVRENFTGFLVDPRGDRFEQTYDAVTSGLAASHRAALSPSAAARTPGRSASPRGTTSPRRPCAATHADDAPTAGHRRRRRQRHRHRHLRDLDLRILPRLSAARAACAPTPSRTQIDDRTSRDRVAHHGASREGAATRRASSVGPASPRSTTSTARGFVLGSYGKGFRSPQALSLGDGESAPFATVLAGDLGVRCVTAWCRQPRGHPLRHARRPRPDLRPRARHQRGQRR